MQSNVFRIRQCAVAMTSALLISTLAGCSIEPRSTRALDVLSRTLSVYAAPIEPGRFQISETEFFRRQSPEPEDPYHKKGMRPATTRLKTWISSDGYRSQTLNADTGELLSDVTQQKLQSGSLRHVRDTVSGVAYTIELPAADNKQPDAVAASQDVERRKSLFAQISTSATIVNETHRATARQVFHIDSQIPYSAARQIIDPALIKSLVSEPATIRMTFDIDTQTYEILGQSISAIDGSDAETILERSSLVSQSTGNLSDLPTNWFQVQSSGKTIETVGFDIHQVASKGQASQRVREFQDGKVISIIIGPRSTLVKGLQSAAPVWDRSSTRSIEFKGNRLIAWLCEGGVIGSDPERRVLIFETEGDLFYITGQSFPSGDDFVLAAVAELEVSK